MYDSGHSDNVFQAKFLPGHNDLIISCAADGQAGSDHRHHTSCLLTHTHTLPHASQLLCYPTHPLLLHAPVATGESVVCSHWLMLAGQAGPGAGGERQHAPAPPSHSASAQAGPDPGSAAVLLQASQSRLGTVAGIQGIEASLTLKDALPASWLGQPSRLCLLYTHNSAAPSQQLLPHRAIPCSAPKEAAVPAAPWSIV